VADTPAFVQQPPRWVMFTSRMKDDLRALFQMTQGDFPLAQRVCSLQVVCATYGFGDASGDGFGAAILLPNGKIYYRHGVWDWGISNEHSSHYRELWNLVESSEKAAAAGLLTNRKSGYLPTPPPQKPLIFAGLLNQGSFMVWC